MPEMWMPGAVKKDLRSGDGKMNGGTAKVVWHRTANKNADGLDDAGEREAAYFAGGGKGAAPHLVWDPFTGQIWQFFPADYRALALRTGAGNPNRAGKYVIQIEIVFENGVTRFGKKYATVADTPLKNLDKIVAWLRTLGIKDEWPGGIPTKDERDTVSWDTFTGEGGHFGHNQVPYNDHVDPGKMPTTMFGKTPATPAPTTPPKEDTTDAKYVWYVAQRGDTQSGIARMYGVSLDRLKGWNNMKDSRLAVGQRVGVLLDAITKAGPGVKAEKVVTRKWHKVVKGDTLFSIAKQYKVSVARLVALNGIKNAALIKVGQDVMVDRTEVTRYVVSAPVVVSPATPTAPSASVSIEFDNVVFNATNSDIKKVQEALNKNGAKLALDGNYGNLTKAAVTAYQKKQKLIVDGVAGPQTLGKLGFKDKPSAPKTKVTNANYEGAKEPASNYTRVYYGGVLVNKRTAEMLDNAKSIAGRSFTMTQGSYNRGGVSASAGTHDGGGAVDIAAASLSSSDRKKIVDALRKAGFAAWLRTPAQSNWPYHIHAIAIGDREASSGAKSQVRSYLQDRNGLASNSRNTDGMPLHWPNWVEKYR